MEQTPNLTFITHNSKVEDNDEENDPTSSFDSESLEIVGTERPIVHMM